MATQKPAKVHVTLQLSNEDNKFRAGVTLKAILSIFNISHGILQGENCEYTHNLDEIPAGHYTLVPLIDTNKLYFIPPLGALTGPDCAPSFSEIHKPATVNKGDFGIYKDLRAGRLLSLWRKIDPETQAIPWRTEEDVQNHVKDILVALIEQLRLDTDVICANEFSVFQITPDIYLLRKISGIPIGMVNVKKPGTIDINFTSNIAGQMFDYLLRLQSFYGLKFAFGIATTLECWQIFWLDPSIEYAKEAQMPSEERKVQDTGDTDNAAMPNQEFIGQSQVREAGDKEDTHVENLDPEEALQLSEEIDRKVFASRVYHREEGDTVQALMTVIMKMYLSPVVAVAEVSDFRPYIVLTQNTWEWRKIKWLKTTLNRNAMPDRNCKRLVLLRDLRGGAEGRVWMVCSISGMVCVVKFTKIHHHITSEPSQVLAMAMAETKRQLEHEVAMYELNGIEAHVGHFGGRPALVMHHYSSTDLSVPADLEGAREAVREAFNNGIYHKDVKPEHIVAITPTKQNSKPRYTLIDMGMSERIEPTASEEHKASILKSMLAGLTLK